MVPSAIRGFVLVFCVLALWQACPAAVSINSGVVNVGADLGCATGSSSGVLTPNDLHDTADLKSRPTGGLSTQGWSSASWSVSETQLVAGGSSTAGFNGASCQLPGAGDGSPTATVQLGVNFFGVNGEHSQVQQQIKN